LEYVLKLCNLSISSSQHTLRNLYDNSMSSRIYTLITDKIVKRLGKWTRFGIGNHLVFSVCFA